MTPRERLGGTGIWSRGLRYHEDRGAVADAAAELEELGYSALFAPDIGGDVLGDVEHLLASTRSVSVVTGILNIWMHEADEIALGCARIEEGYPGRFQLGLGASHAAVVDATGRGRYRRPLSTMRSYLDRLDAAAPPVPSEARLLAALGPRMLELARDRAGGAHPYLVPVEHTRIARAALGEQHLLAPEQGVILEPDPSRARERAREDLAGYLQLPNYTNNLLRLGFTEADLRDGGSDRLLDALFVRGDEEAVAERLAAHREAGADHVCLQVIGAVEDLPRREWRRLAAIL